MRYRTYDNPWVNCRTSTREIDLVETLYVDGGGADVGRYSMIIDGGTSSSIFIGTTIDGGSA